MNKTRVLLVDDHVILRQGLCALLDHVDWLEVVAEAGDGEEAVQKVAACNPHVVLMDIQMPNVNGIEAAARIAREYPDVRVIILSMHSSEEYVRRTLEVGARGYLLKVSSLAEIETAVRAVMDGGVYLAGTVSRSLLEKPRDRKGGTPLDQLTPRQVQVMKRMVQGFSTKQIARQLGIKEKTVESHRGHVQQKLGVYDLANLTRLAIRCRLISENDDPPSLSSRQRSQLPVSAQDWAPPPTGSGKS